jgi:NAD(P)-dependent dehydrogenase (short-subunit alcohol dehydrogenase family)
MPGTRLQDRVAIVTGAGQGVGRGIALAFANEGALVAVTGRTKSKCDGVAAEIAARGGRAVSLACDVESRQAIDDAVAATMAEFGRIDIVANSAQSMVYTTLRKLSDDELQSMWQSGPVGTLHMMQATFDQLRANKGCVINLGSGSSIMPHPMMGGYAMAKESIRVLTRVAAAEWGRFGIRVNAICPLAESPGWESFGGDTGAQDAVLAQVLLGRMGDCELDIGRAAVYLASEDASYVTGTTLMVDGGFNYLR